MKNVKKIWLTGLVAALALTSTIAQAHPPGRGGWHGGGWHGGVGVYFGAPYPYFPYAYSPYAYPYPYVYNPPPVVITQPQPQVYIEQGSGASSTAPSAPAQTTPPTASAGNNGQSYWYYCEPSDSYYPYVKECAADWKQVTPTPPAK